MAAMASDPYIERSLKTCLTVQSLGSTQFFILCLFYLVNLSYYFLYFKYEVVPFSFKHDKT